MKKQNQNNNVEEMLRRLPKGYEEACIDTKAIERKREIKNPIDLIKLVLIYLVGGYSQLEMSVIAMELEIGKLSDVGFLKKFAKCKEWICWIIAQIKPQAIIEYTKPKGLEIYHYGGRCKRRNRKGAFRQSFPITLCY